VHGLESEAIIDNVNALYAFIRIGVSEVTGIKQLRGRGTGGDEI